MPGSPVERFLKREFGVVCDAPELVAQALTHRSAARFHNERMEFLGDAVLGLVVAEAMYARHDELREGALTRARARVVKRDSLATAARRIGLGQHLVLGPGELRSGGRERDSILADALEALLGAIYLANGLQVARDAVLKVLAPELSTAGQQSDKDSKTRLQEFLQGRGLNLPEYAVRSVDGEDHQQTFTVECRVAALDIVVAAGGSSRRHAEQAAAEVMLDTIHRSASAR